jgi:hypothetical protein
MSVSLAERRMMEALVAELHRAMVELPARRQRPPRDHAEAREENRTAPHRTASTWRSRIAPTAER